MRAHLPWLASALIGLGTTTASQVINVEIDYMVEPGDHSHMPTAAEIAALVKMFQCNGYTLNVVVDDAIPHSDFMRCDFPGVDDFWTCDSETFTTYESIKDQWFDAPFAGIGWHYCVFGHQYNDGLATTNSSGLAELGGNDLVVTLGSFRLMTPNAEIGTPFDRAATFAHELGHNLGLRHFAKGSVLSSGPWAPNYASIMSYQYQLAGVRSQMECLGLASQATLFKDLDYSHGRLPTVLEGALDESVGVGIHQVDWDCDGSLDPGLVAQDLDNAQPWCAGGGSAVGSLGDFDDWSNLDDDADQASVVDGSAQLETISCITREEVDAMRAGVSLPGLVDPTVCTGTSPALFIEGCRNGLMIWVDPSAGGLPLGTGNNPMLDLPGAVQLAPDQSILYLQPGTYTNAGASIVITKEVILAGPGGAVVDP